MGGCISNRDNKEIIRTCTLNYCGISYSPFQFYFKEHEEDLRKISYIFKSLVKHYVQDFKEEKFKWDMGKIEKNFKLGRYSNMFYKQVGIEKHMFISRKDFQKSWDNSYKKYLLDNNLKAQDQRYQEQVCLYDFIMYHTLLKFVYGDQSFEELIKNDPTLFRKTLEPFYKISFLNEEIKLQKFKTGLLNNLPDVLFIQEYSNVLLYNLKNNDYYSITIDKRNDSLIALNRNFFKTDENCDNIVSDLRKKHTWFEQSAITVANRIIFCCVHLTSNEEKNRQQVIQLKKGIQVLIEEYKDYNFIIGGDINSFIKFQQKGINFYPQIRQQFTTLKKRTASQAQYHKAEIEIKESKDKIISSLPLVNCGITFINDQHANDKSYLPTDDHPHDHFLVQAQIILRKE